MFRYGICWTSATTFWGSRCPARCPLPISSAALKRAQTPSRWWVFRVRGAMLMHLFDSYRKVFSTRNMMWLAVFVMMCRERRMYMLVVGCTCNDALRVRCNTRERCARLPRLKKYLTSASGRESQYPRLSVAESVDIICSLLYTHTPSYVRCLRTSSRGYW